MTNYNVEQKNLYGESSITREHVQNNVSVRSMLGERGIRPEELPVAEDIKKAMEAGMNDHVAKPVDMKVLTAVLQKYLEK